MRNALTIKQMLAQAQSQDVKPFMMPSVLYTQSFMAYRRGDYAQAKGLCRKGVRRAAGRQRSLRARTLFGQSLNKLGQTG
jgi:hypothetical protein